MSDVSRLGVPLAIGLGWTVERPLAGGEFGALLVERRGVHAVFKVMPKDAKSEWLEEALFVASQLLETGYPSRGISTLARATATATPSKSTSKASPLVD